MPLCLVLQAGLVAGAAGAASSNALSYERMLWTDVGVVREEQRSLQSVSINVCLAVQMWQMFLANWALCAVATMFGRLLDDHILQARMHVAAYALQAYTGIANIGPSNRSCDVTLQASYL